MLYPIERYLSLHELIEIYASSMAGRFGLDMSAARLHREGVKLLLQVQSNAYQNNHIDDTIAIAESLVGVYFAAGDFQAARPFAEQYLQLIRERESPSVLARALGMVSTIDYQGGNAETAHAITEQALELLTKSDRQRSLGGFLLCQLATTACYLAKYGEAEAHLQQADEWFRAIDNDLGLAWQRHTNAREYMRDNGAYQAAADALIEALPILEARTSPQAVIENLLATVDCLRHLKQLHQAHVLLERLDALIINGKRRWYLAELMMVKGQVALAADDPAAASRFLREGIGAVSLNGDMRALSPLYRLLGVALSYLSNARDTASDAFERSIACARSNARKIDLAWALHETGQFLKRTSIRPTEQARSSGYLFEARKLFMEMLLPPPPL
jgi:tetratricopeptide (TPR) repeat protein